MKNEILEAVIRAAEKATVSLDGGQTFRWLDVNFFIKALREELEEDFAHGLV